jgi:phosphomannomutase
MNDEPTGLFAHEPEPTAANLTGLCWRVKKEHADLGFAQDPDADRLAVADEKGVYIGEEYTLALAARKASTLRIGDGRNEVSRLRASKCCFSVSYDTLTGMVVRLPLT